MLAQVRVLVDDFAKSFAFYEQVLGLTAQEGQDGSGPYACFKAPGSTDLALFDRALMAGAVGATAGERGTADHVVLVLRVEDVDRVHAEAVARGAQPASEPADQPAWGMRVAHVRAPEGTLVEFCSYGD
ncbi:VOC family protein [Streptacidiphilus monticola]|jgi:predicted enzyme related to lactoylglutathione lyase|uniref:VOC family protein n=1 Tax=Streptacidiphilus monticola TaxID=2161674 RepID=A0ABW1G8U4_9ACTN